jgi:hypothetical protein
LLRGCGRRMYKTRQNRGFTLARIPMMKKKLTKQEREEQRHKGQILLLAVILERKCKPK